MKKSNKQFFDYDDFNRRNADLSEEEKDQLLIDMNSDLDDNDSDYDWAGIESEE